MLEAQRRDRPRAEGDWFPLQIPCSKGSGLEEEKGENKQTKEQCGLANQSMALQKTGVHAFVQFLVFSGIRRENCMERICYER